jgi:hypothetical protein
MHTKADRFMFLSMDVGKLRDLEIGSGHYFRSYQDPEGRIQVLVPGKNVFNRKGENVPVGNVA